MEAQLSSEGAEAKEASRSSSSSLAESASSTEAGHDRHGSDMNDRHADFIRSRGGLCIAKEVRMLY